MKAKLGLAVLGILIPRDLASCPKLFFFLNKLFLWWCWINWRKYSSFQRSPKFYICFTRSQKAKLWRINGVVILLCKMIRAYVQRVATVFNLETFPRVFATKLNHFFSISGSCGGLCMLILSFNLLEQKLKEHMSPALYFFFWVSSLAMLSAWNLVQNERSRSVRPYCDVAKPCDNKCTRIRAFAQKFQKWAILGPISLQPSIKKLSEVINCLKSIIFYKFMPK